MKSSIFLLLAMLGVTTAVGSGIRGTIMSKAKVGQSLTSGSNWSPGDLLHDVNAGLTNLHESLFPTTCKYTQAELDATVDQATQSLKRAQRRVLAEAEGKAAKAEKELDAAMKAIKKVERREQDLIKRLAEADAKALELDAAMKAIEKVERREQDLIKRLAEADAKALEAEKGLNAAKQQAIKEAERSKRCEGDKRSLAEDLAESRKLVSKYEKVMRKEFNSWTSKAASAEAKAAKAEKKLGAAKQAIKKCEERERAQEREVKRLLREVKIWRPSFGPTK